MYYQWIYDQEENHKMYKDYTTYLGAFSNYEMAKSIFDKEKVSKKHESSDDEFNKSFELLEQEGEEMMAVQQAAAARKQRKIIR